MSRVFRKLFLEDAYLTETAAKVVEINDRGGIILDQTIFYGTSGGQPGDTGKLQRANGSVIEIATTVCGQNKEELILVPASPDNLPEIGESVTAELDWDRRHRLMRMHTALHLLCASVPFPVTGGQIGTTESRLDFDMPESMDREALTLRLNTLVAENHPVSQRWIDDAELEAQPELIRTMSVKPPMGSGKVRLVSIGENDEIDLQPCGGTHVRATGEIGALEVYKIENKGKQNRRIRVRLAEGAV
uniref:alanyl-tRNA editing protein n=1 Tax=Pararhizobium sp. IMCC3301 TaxID=3067904 RepID=UPI0027408177|nr:alanyl-tRNA editing protein [Pararhizobium sp. IMCC3301]